MKTYVGDQPVTFKGPAVRVAVKDPAAKSLGTLRAKSVAGAAELPGVVDADARQGPGRLPRGGVRLGATTSTPTPTSAWSSATRSTGRPPAPPPVVVEAPMCVHSTVMRQAKGGSERLIVHLFNDLNTTAHHALPDDDVPLREEVVPIHDIRVTFGPSYRLRRVHLEPGGMDLEIEKTPEGTTRDRAPAGRACDGRGGVGGLAPSRDGHGEGAVGSTSASPRSRRSRTSSRSCPPGRAGPGNVEALRVIAGLAWAFRDSLG